MPCKVSLRPGGFLGGLSVEATISAARGRHALRDISPVPGAHVSSRNDSSRAFRFPRLLVRSFWAATPREASTEKHSSRHDIQQHNPMELALCPNVATALLTGQGFVLLSAACAWNYRSYNAMDVAVRRWYVSLMGRVATFEGAVRPRSCKYTILRLRLGCAPVAAKKDATSYFALWGCANPTGIIKYPRIAGKHGILPRRRCHGLSLLDGVARNWQSWVLGAVGAAESVRSLSDAMASG